MFYCFCWIEILSMTKCQEKRGENDSPSFFLLSTFSFMELLYFAPTERLISPAHATSLHRPDDDLVSNSCNLSCVWFLSIQSILVNSDIKSVNIGIILTNSQNNFTVVGIAIGINCFKLKENPNCSAVLYKIKRIICHFGRLSSGLVPDVLLSFTKKIWKKLLPLQGELRNTTKEHGFLRITIKRISCTTHKKVVILRFEPTKCKLIDDIINRWLHNKTSFQLKSRTYVTIGKILDGPPAYKNDLSIHPCSSWVAINSATTIIQVFSFSTRKSELQCWSNNGIEGRACIYCTSSTHAIKRDFVHVFKI